MLVRRRAAAYAPGMRPLLLSLLVCSGCSLAFQRPASCSRVLPIVDLALVGTEVMTAGAGMLMHDGVIFDRRDKLGTGIAGVALFAAVLQGASAGNGWRSADACRAAVTAAR